MDIKLVKYHNKFKVIFNNKFIGYVFLGRRTFKENPQEYYVDPLCLIVSSFSSKKAIGGFSSKEEALDFLMKLEETETLEALKRMEEATEMFRSHLFACTSYFKAKTS